MTVTGDDLLGEAPVLLGRDRALVRAQRELVLLLAGDRVLAPQVLGGLEHAAGHRVVVATGGHARAGEPVGERAPRRRGAPAQLGRVHSTWLMLSAPPASTSIRGAGLHPHGSA